MSLLVERDEELGNIPLLLPRKQYVATKLILE
jgi:hypothetical protein